EGDAGDRGDGLGHDVRLDELLDDRAVWSVGVAPDRVDAREGLVVEPAGLDDRQLELFPEGQRHGDAERRYEYGPDRELERTGGPEIHDDLRGAETVGRAGANRPGNPAATEPRREGLDGRPRAGPNAILVCRLEQRVRHQTEGDHRGG